MDELLLTLAHPANVKPLNREINRKATLGFLSVLGVGDITPDSSRAVSPLSTEIAADTPVVERERTGPVRVGRSEHIRARSQSPPQDSSGKFHANLPVRSDLSDTYDNSVSPSPSSTSPAITSLPLQRSPQRSPSVSSCPSEQKQRRMPTAKEGSNRPSDSIFNISRTVDTNSQQTSQRSSNERGHSPVLTQPTSYSLEESALSKSPYQYLGVPPVFPPPTTAAPRMPQQQSIGPLAPFPVFVPPVSSAFPSQSRPQFAYPIHPNASLTHPTEFAPFRFLQVISHTQPPISLSTPSLAPHFPPPRHAPVPPERYVAPAMLAEYDFGVNVSCSSTAGPTYPIQQQTYPSFNYQPAMSSTPQLVPAPPAFPTHAPPYLSQPMPAPAPLPPPYAGYTGQPTSVESTPAHQRPLQWWYMSSHAGSQSTGGPYPGLYRYDGFHRQPRLASPSNDSTLPATQVDLAARGKQELISAVRSIPSSMASQHSQKSLSGAADPLQLPELPGRHPLVTPGKSTQKHGSPTDSDGLMPDSSDLAPSHGTNTPSAQESEAHKEQEYKPNFQKDCASISSVSQITRRVARQGQQVHRSEWVMWVGNVPSDATEDELPRFFAKSGDPCSPNRQVPVTGLDCTLQVDLDGAGITSIFLIARSKCAFVNYASQEYLQRAVARFNGQQLRPHDARCPRLVCRIRGKEEDQRAGVGGQRNTGMHVRWIKEQEHKRKEQKAEQDQESSLIDDEEDDQSEFPPASSIERDDGVYESATSSIHLLDNGHENFRRSLDLHSNSSASTTSSILSRHFPRRYFIMKSLTQHDLDLSVSRGLWATQPHNESVLNQAYRSSTDVLLIFGVNKSGEFFGYARMAGPIGRSEERITWASRSNSQASQMSAPSIAPSDTGNGSDVKGTMSKEGDTVQETGRNSGRDDTRQQESSGLLFSPSERRLVEDSPRALTPDEAYCLSTTEHAPGLESASAPPSNRSKVHQVVPPVHASAPPVLHGPARVHLGSEAPLRTIREEQVRSPDAEQSSDVERDTMPNQSAASVSEVVSTTSGATPHNRLNQIIDNAAEDDATESSAPTVWGTAFKVQWLQVGRLPFHRTRHLRNFWNHDREVKVSRDGTELEPSVGQALLDEWDKDASQLVGPGSIRRGNLGRRSNQTPV